MSKINEAAELLANNVDPQMNILKVVEECAELQEVMTKYITKRPDLKPTKEKLVEEMGDVLFRIIVASKMLDIEKQVHQRLEDKAQTMYNWAVTKFN